jgi:hypothetical protein
MQFSNDLWVESISQWPSCPTKNLQQTIADQEITIKNFPEIKLLLKQMEKHEQEIKNLREHIQSRIERFEKDMRLGKIQY